MWQPCKYAICFPRKSLNQKLDVKVDFLLNTLKLASIRDQKQLIVFCVEFVEMYLKKQT